MSEAVTVVRPVAPLIDPVDALATRTAERCGLAIDPLQIAAMLESDGMTDRMAADDYGYADVFALAEDVYRRLPRRGASAAAERPDRRRALREISHGLLYSLPGGIFPAAATVLGAKPTVTGMVFATAVGWVWNMGVSWIAYRMLSMGRGDLTAKVLLWGLLLGVTIPGSIAAILLPSKVLPLVFAQLLYQVASGILLFHKRESVLFAVMLPAVAVGLWFIFVTHTMAMAMATISAGLAAVVLAGIVAVLLVTKVDPVREPEVSIRSELLTAWPILSYAALSAVYLLSADARFVSQPDLALSVVPIVLGMGVLEWRARRFNERSSELLRRTRYPSEFRRKILLTFAADWGVAVGTLTTLATALGFFLYTQEELTMPGAAALLGHVLLGGAYFTGFLLINSSHFGRLLGALACVVAGYLVAVAHFGPAHQVHVFAACSALLVSALVAGLIPSLGQVWRYA